MLPAVAQIVSVLAVPQSAGEMSETSSPKAAFAYFLTATFMSGLCLAVFLVLLSRHNISISSNNDSKPLFRRESDSGEHDVREAGAGATGGRRSVPLLVLWRKLIWPSFAIFVNFCLTMVFPVFTQAIHSVQPGSGRAFQSDVFIPAAFLLWNVGDLSGRIACGWEAVTVRNVRLLVLLAVGRAVFVPLYLMCNVGGRGAVVDSDAFYWLVELAFGFTNGWVGTSCMVVAPDYVDDDEKEACGSFMGLCLVLGLATGSLLSFFVLL